MFPQVKLKQLFLTTSLFFALFNSVELHLTSNTKIPGINLTNQAVAKSSGARSGGGSFKKKSSSSKSSKSSSSSSRSRNKSTNSSTYSNSDRRRRYSSSGDNYDYDRTSPGSYNSSRVSSNNSGSGIIMLFVALIFVGPLAFIVLFAAFNSIFSKNKSNSSQVEKERDNDIVTISKLQVALSVQAKDVQKELSQLSTSVDTDTDEGLLELLQESILILLRNSEYWTHVLSSSESIDINEAESTFDKLSFAERSKFSAETLTNVDGRVNTKEVVSAEGEVASYIVVTLLLGTADDRALFAKVHSIEELQEILEKLASIRDDYLMKFELLWSPQVENDSLTYDELLTEYTDMIQII